AGRPRVPGGRAGGGHGPPEGDAAAAEDPVDLAVDAGPLLDRLQCEGVLVVGAHQLEVADAQRDGIHGEVAGEVLLARGGARGGGRGEGRGGHGGPFGRRVMAPFCRHLIHFSIIRSCAVPQPPSAGSRARGSALSARRAVGPAPAPRRGTPPWWRRPG